MCTDHLHPDVAPTCQSRDPERPCPFRHAADMEMWRRSEMTRSIALGVALAFLLGLAAAGGVAARADRQTAPVMWHPQTGLSGSVAPDAQATLVRRPGGVSFSF